MRKEVTRLITLANWVMAPNKPNPSTPSNRAARIPCAMLRAAEVVLALIR
jgi:hypothetical protein